MVWHRHSFISMNEPKKMQENIQPYNGRGISRLLRAFLCSMLGLRQAFVKEAAFRQELALAVILTPVAWRLGEGRVEQVMLIASLLLLLIVELLNSAVEAAIDRIGPEYHPLSGRAKDIGSAAVFLAMINAALVWAALLWP